MVRVKIMVMIIVMVIKSLPSPSPCHIIILYDVMGSLVLSWWNYIWDLGRKFFFFSRFIQGITYFIAPQYIFVADDNLGENRFFNWLRGWCQARWNCRCCKLSYCAGETMWLLECYFLQHLLQRCTANPPMARMVVTQKIFPMDVDPGIWGQPCRLVLSQKAENMLILKRLEAGRFSAVFMSYFRVWVS